jgi:hypothetical protein
MALPLTRTLSITVSSWRLMHPCPCWKTPVIRPSKSRLIRRLRGRDVPGGRVGVSVKELNDVRQMMALDS